MNILIAEDDPVSRKILQAVLEKLGHTVYVAEDGAQAWELYKRHKPPVVVSDWMMPQIDGLAFCQKVREVDDNHYTYFILLTALEGRENHLKAMEAGVDDFMTKPLDRESIWMRLQVAERILNYINHIRKLENQIITICAWSKQVKVSENEWKDVDVFLKEALGAQVSHGISPEVYKRRLEEEGLG